MLEGKGLSGFTKCSSMKYIRQCEQSLSHDHKNIRSSFLKLPIKDGGEFCTSAYIFISNIVNGIPKLTIA